jgi:hypothetical protein
MGGAEGVVDVSVRQARQALGQTRIVLGLARLPAGVLQYEHPSGLERVGLCASVLAHHIRRLDHGSVDQLGEPARGRLQRCLRLTILRTAQVRAQDEPRIPFEQQLDRRHRRPDARVVGDLAALERHVEVHPHENPRPGL